jgi:hypothetical protein
LRRVFVELQLTDIDVKGMTENDVVDVVAYGDVGKYSKEERESQEQSLPVIHGDRGTHKVQSM